MALDQILSMLQRSNTNSPFFPPTELYNEGWLLRLVLHWFSSCRIPNHPLDFNDSGRWFSEALLPSAFKPRWQGDPLGESRTHADGVIGNFIIGNQGKADLSLEKGGTHLVVTEAKIFSKLSKGVTHAKYFDQAARTVACIAEILCRSDRLPSSIKTGFYVLAPKDQITSGIFEKEMNKRSILSKVQKRVSEYDGEKDQWMSEWFETTLKNINIECLSWEKIIEEISSREPDCGATIGKFYQNCIRFNG